MTIATIDTATTSIVHHTNGQHENISQQWTRPRVLNSITEKVETASGNMYVSVSLDECGQPIEVFIRIGKMGSVEHAHLSGLGRVISYALQVGADPEGIIRRLEGITSEPTWHMGECIRSAEDGVAKTLRRVVDAGYTAQQAA